MERNRPKLTEAQIKQVDELVAKYMKEAATAISEANVAGRLGIAGDCKKLLVTSFAKYILDKPRPSDVEMAEMFEKSRLPLIGLFHGRRLEQEGLARYAVEVLKSEEKALMSELQKSASVYLPSSIVTVANCLSNWYLNCQKMKLSFAEAVDESEDVLKRILVVREQ